MDNVKRKPAFNIEKLEKDTRIHYYKSSGPGGQHKNKRETAVRLVHLPTGLKAVATEFRSQFQNRELAFRRLKKRILELTKRRKPRKITAVPVGLKERILKEKKIHSEVKKLRKKVSFSEDG